MLKWIKDLIGSGIGSTHSHSFVGKSYVLRDGRSIEADAAFGAWTDGDLDRMLARHLSFPSLVP
jgi:hypothetical protein